MRKATTKAPTIPDKIIPIPPKKICPYKSSARRRADDGWNNEKAGETCITNVGDADRRGTEKDGVRWTECRERLVWDDACGKKDFEGSAEMKVHCMVVEDRERLEGIEWCSLTGIRR